MRPTRPHRFRAVRLIVLGAVLVALLATAGSVVRGYLEVGVVRVPDVHGLAFEAAAARVRDVGLEPSAYVEVAAGAAPNEVVSQTPAGGTSVRPGRQVVLGVNGLQEVVTLPTLVGLREGDAVARVEALGAVVERVAYVGSDRPAGSVVVQQPAAGAALARGVGVRLSVSRGPVDAPVTLPDLVGTPVEAAAAELAALGIRHVEQVAADLSFDRPFAVTDQRPAAGSSVLPSTPVTLVYALEGTRVVEVPDVAGLPLWRAQLTLRAAQLQVGAVQRIDDPALAEGVVETRPAGYTVVGSPVVLVVNGPADDLGAPIDAEGPLRPFDFGAFGSGDAGAGDVDRPPDDVPAPGTTVAQADGSRLIPFRFDPASVGVPSLATKPYRLTLVVVDDEGERTVLDRELNAGEGVAISVRIVGDEPLVQTYIDGAFFQAWRP
ncbi:MAG: PASTA domain-containing protein [Trueperaceae bacterium]|nr:PASTA domain-containing protein [Trueperaceae bacterium]